MNFLFMKYAVEIAETNSINKASETLFVSQSALSRAIKELETSLGVSLFDRSAKGMFLTPDGEIFVNYAKAILKQVDDVENIFCNGSAANKHFSISVPRASYISNAFSEFTCQIPHDEKLDIFYKETNSRRAIKNILEENYKLGIVRYAANYDQYYKILMEEKGLASELITEFSYVLIMNENCPLASVNDITYDDLKDYLVIAHADPYVPSISLSKLKRAELPDNASQRIFVFERGSQFELLSQNPKTYMWVSPVPEKTLKRFGLVQKICKENQHVYKDVLIHKKEYEFSELDNVFIEQLIQSKRKIIG